MHIVLAVQLAGAGAVGGLFGARLVRAGADVAFIARGETLRALRSRGIRIESSEGDFHVLRVAATDDFAEVAPADAVLVAVKAGQIAVLASALRPLLVPRTVVIPLQNGAEAAEQLAALLGREHVLGGFCRVIAQQVGPGHIRHSGVVPTVALGIVPESRVGLVAEAQKSALRQAGIRVEEPEDLGQAL